jgi:hypothetical protein
MFPSGQRTRSYNTKKLSFRERLRNWLMNNENRENDLIATEPSSDFGSNPFRLNIYRARGGTVVETRFYNRPKDENEYRLHVITDDKELGQEIGKIIVMESLRG